MNTANINHQTDFVLTKQYAAAFCIFVFFFFDVNVCVRGPAQFFKDPPFLFQPTMHLTCFARAIAEAKVCATFSLVPV